MTQPGRELNVQLAAPNQRSVPTSNAQELPPWPRQYANAGLSVTHGNWLIAQNPLSALFTLYFVHKPLPSIRYTQAKNIKKSTMIIIAGQ